MKKLIFILLFLCGFSSAANAYIECPVKLTKIFAGDDQAIWATSEQGVTFVIYKDNVNQKNAFTLMTAALMAGNTIIVRFSTSTQCSGTLSDFAGIWILRK